MEGQSILTDNEHAQRDEIDTLQLVRLLHLGVRFGFILDIHDLMPSEL